MKKSIAFLLLTSVFTTLMLAGCGSTASSSTKVNSTSEQKSTVTGETQKSSADVSVNSDAAQSTTEEKTFTLKELAAFDGQNGNPAYVAVDGVVYDVSSIPQWQGGKHHGYTAGTDMTEPLHTESPHGVKVLEELPVVGKLV